MRRRRRTGGRSQWSGYAFLLPWFAGFFGLTLGPALASLYLSFTNYDLIGAPSWVGLANYVRIVSADAKVAESVRVTLLYVAMSVPLKLVLRARRRHGAEPGHPGAAAVSRAVLPAVAAGGERRNRDPVAPRVRGRRAGEPRAGDGGASRGRAGCPIPTPRCIRWWPSACGSSARR